ncbi:DUF3562 domain-containing protein [Cupriavidus sp. OV038]|uniref:DUF3562 domain-containing protein n=1 Tax=unclassified Cupriavidus TaxID=2640874 RepID=UPI0035127F2B
MRTAPRCRHLARLPKQAASTLGVVKTHVSTSSMTDSDAGTGNPEPASGEDSGRPPLAVQAIERIALRSGIPKEVVRQEFWSAWDALLSDAKFKDYVLLFAEKRVLEVLRRKYAPQSSLDRRPDSPGA